MGVVNSNGWPESGLTVFGACLLELMARRGVRTWADLSIMLRTRSYYFTPQRISNWAYGRHAVSNDFSAAIRETLGLEDEEITQLAMAFTYGQNKFVSARSA